jgi:hypothetical protein
MRLKVIIAGILALGLCTFSRATIVPIFIDSGPKATSARFRQVIRKPPETAVIIEGVPTSRWTYGCAATAAGMIFGYYDRNGYPDVYTGPKNTGVAPLRGLGRRTALIVSKKGLDKNRSWGHVNDYWERYGYSGPDPYVIEGQQEHTWDCVADFLGTNQWKWDYYGSDGQIDFNVDGSTALWAYSSSGEKLYDYIPPESAGLPQTSLCHGLKLFAESRGYSVSENYTQKIDTLFEDGFSFEDFKDEIDSGQPVIIQLQGHSMVGLGYNDVDSIIYVHDTWDNRLHWMEWGQSYAGMDQIAVTVLHLEAPEVSGVSGLGLQPSGQLFIVPEPATVVVLLLGMLFLRHSSDIRKF